MGQHFDGLVKIANAMPRSTKVDEVGRLKPYLNQLIDASALVELGFSSNAVRRSLEMDKHQFLEYRLAYQNLSAQHGHWLNIPSIGPYSSVAIEDFDSLTIIQERGEGLLWSIHAQKTKARADSYLITIGYVHIDPFINERKTLLRPDVKYYALLRPNGTIDEDWTNEQNREQVSTHDISVATMVACEEVCYIMDPRFWIVQRETNQSELNRAKTNPQGQCLSVNRPTYVIRDTDGVRALWRREGQSLDKSHFVSGHDRTYPEDSPHFPNMAGKTIRIDAHFTGDGYLRGRNGVNFHVMDKSGFTRVVPYQNKSRRTEEGTVTAPESATQLRSSNRSRTSPIFTGAENEHTRRARQGLIQ